MPSFKKKSFKKSKSSRASKDSKNAINISSSQVWIYGKHPVEMALLNKKRKVSKILVTQSSSQDLLEFIQENNLKIDKNLISTVEAEDINANFFGKVIHQGIAIISSKLSLISDNEFLSKIENSNQGNILILDQLTDPHNIGAIIRSSVAFGVKNIVLLKQSFGGENPTICKSSSGAIENANIILAGNLNNFISKVKDSGYWVAGLDGNGKNDFNEITTHDKICLIIGNEGSGIRTLVKKNCDLLLKIPISSDIESLNASNAAAIALYEISK